MNVQAFHDFAAMAFDRLDAEAEPLRYLARPLSFGNQFEHLNLTFG